MQLKFIKDIFEPGFTHLTVGKVYEAYASEADDGFYVITDDGTPHYFTNLNAGPQPDGFNPNDCWEQV